MSRLNFKKESDGRCFLHKYSNYAYTCNQGTDPSWMGLKKGFGEALKFEYSDAGTTLCKGT